LLLQGYGPEHRGGFRERMARRISRGMSRAPSTHGGEAKHAVVDILPG